MSNQQLHTWVRMTVSWGIVAILISCSGEITVTPPTLKSITVTPAKQKVAFGNTLQYKVDATLSDGTVDANLSISSLVWKSSAPSFATISPTGLLSSVAAGTAIITATLGAVTASTTVTVTGPSVFTGAYYTLAIKSDGTLWGWGKNYQGQLGIGIESIELEPIQIQPAIKWASVSAGDEHSLAITTEGKLWAWGNNANGKLGNEFANNVTVLPFQIETPGNWVAVSAGYQHSLAIKDDGTLWAWGNNSNGQLGVGSTEPFKTVPTQIGKDITWVFVSAGTHHTFAIKANGTLWAWGANINDRLGSGVGADQIAPIPIGDDINWASVSSGDNHTTAIKADGTRWAWGVNSHGQIGDKTFVNILKPTQIMDGSKWVSVSSGELHTIGIKAGGAMWIWGDNGNGQLGKKAINASSLPVEILP